MNGKNAMGLACFLSLLAVAVFVKATVDDVNHQLKNTVLPEFKPGLMTPGLDWTVFWEQEAEFTPVDSNIKVLQIELLQGDSITASEVRDIIAKKGYKPLGARSAWYFFKNQDRIPHQFAQKDGLIQEGEPSESYGRVIFLGATLKGHEGRMFSVGLRKMLTGEWYTITCREDRLVAPLYVAVRPQ